MKLLIKIGIIDKILHGHYYVNYTFFTEKKKQYYLRLCCLLEIVTKNKILNNFN